MSALHKLIMNIGTPGRNRRVANVLQALSLAASLLVAEQSPSDV